MSGASVRPPPPLVGFWPVVRPLFLFPCPLRVCPFRARCVGVFSFPLLLRSPLCILVGVWPVVRPLFLFPCPFRVCPFRARCVGVGVLSFSRERLRRVLRKKAAVILHLHTLTSADLHLHTLTPADLHLHTLTSADLHLHTLTSADVKV